MAATPTTCAKVCLPGMSALFFKWFRRVRIHSGGQIGLARTEAFRVGFKDAWQSGEFKDIVEMARRVPEAVIQEDPALLLYYDNALMRVGE